MVPSQNRKQITAEYSFTAIFNFFFEMTPFVHKSYFFKNFQMMIKELSSE
ncbi:hypothetical protein HMPREF1984_00338 [Leptotrichia sp. oral taxon 215 str. W9775]|nr:hypothetical protein HMPREF1984_00338 [Leptotrichia sp. oral taxon 215 str. W9775]